METILEHANLFFKTERMAKMENCIDKEKLKAEYYDESYVVLYPIDEREDNRTFLVRQRETGKLFVKKEVTIDVYYVLKDLKNVNNPHIVAIEGLYTSEKGLYYVIEEYISGETLFDLLQKRGHLNENEAINIVDQILDGLMSIHNLGIIHRDIKPDNIMISNDGVVKLVDFGIARTVSEEKNRDTRLLGTEGFAAPEQFGFRQTDCRTDIYATGVILNLLLTGSYPKDHVYEGLLLKKVIEKATSLDPNDRYTDALKMKTAIHVRQPEFLALGWPGFRSNVLWKKIIAGFVYGFGIFFFGIFFADALFLHPKNPILETISASFAFLISPLIMGNVFYWDFVFSKYLKLPRPVAIILRIIIAIIIFIFGMDMCNEVAKR